MLLVNLAAGPGSGKSTTSATVFAILKMHGIRCEYVPEYAKDVFWEGRDFDQLQIQILGKQHARLRRLESHVDVAVTDSPLLLAAVYNLSGLTHLPLLARELHDRFNNLNFFIERVKPYHKYGRGQTEDEARALDEQVLAVLDGDPPVPYERVSGSIDGAAVIAQAVCARVGVTYKLDELIAGL